MRSGMNDDQESLRNIIQQEKRLRQSPIGMPARAVAVRLRDVALQKFEPFYTAYDELRREGVRIMEDGEWRTIRTGVEMRREIERLGVPNLRQTITRTRNITITLVTSTGRITSDTISDIRYRCVIRDQSGDLDQPSLFSVSRDAVVWFVRNIMAHATFGDPPPPPENPLAPLLAAIGQSPLLQAYRRSQEILRSDADDEIGVGLFDPSSSPAPGPGPTSHYREIILDED